MFIFATILESFEYEFFELVDEKRIAECQGLNGHDYVSESV